MEILLESRTGNMLTTVAIGEPYYSQWRKAALPGWERYCRQHGIGLSALIHSPVDQSSPYRKLLHWEKLLVLDEISRIRPDIVNICYIDSDFLISPIAPDVFSFYTDKESIALVSQVKNIPYPAEVLRRVAFFRNRCYSDGYPLDSSLFMPIHEMGAYHGLPPLYDYACSGFFLAGIKEHAAMFKDLFYQHTSDVQSLEGGSEEYHFNHHVQQHGKIQWLPYRFQSLWLYEMAWKYPFLYHHGRENEELMKQCIETSLLENYFLHFAGSWHECDMWKTVPVYTEEESLSRARDYATYLQTPVTGKPVGIVKPNTLSKR